MKSVANRKYKMKCDICGHVWEVAAEDYDPQIKTKQDLALFKKEELSRRCPLCTLKQEKETTSKEGITMEKLKLDIALQEPRFSLERDVILPKNSRLQIDEALVKIRYHKKIYEEWNFKSVDPCGAGSILNFYGKSGTGKTLTAEALAGTLGLKFMGLGLADIESKFMGETAKNIKAVFEYAGQNHAVLFFDEADTLLGKRLSQVTQGIDNEVNSLRSTLLMELEKFEGIVIFASNFEENYDKAFESRITHHIRFDLPDVDGRRLLWKKFLIPAIPLKEEREKLILKLSEVSDGLSGRDIRTCLRLALPKAILDAQLNDSKEFLSLSHLEEAMEQVRQAHKEVGSEVSTKNRSDSSDSTALRLLGARIKNSTEADKKTENMEE